MLGASPRGLVLAREKGWLLAWDKDNWLYLLDRKGQLQAQVRAPAALATACCAEDGSAFAVAGHHGEVCFLAPDLVSRWQRVVPERAVAVALDLFGQYLAVADAQGHVHVFDRLGRSVCQLTNPRPLQYLTFVPEAPYLLGSADFGLVACFDLTGHAVWHDGPVVHVGSLAVSGDGSRILLGCFSEGLRGYTLTGRKLERLGAPEPCRLAALTYDGRYTLVAGMGPRLFLLDRAGRTLATHELDQPAVGLALDALGDRAAVALGDGRVLDLDLREALPLQRRN
jgi:hypothetical protein